MRRHYYLLDSFRALAAFAVLFWHYIHFYRQPGGGTLLHHRSDQPLFHYFSLLYTHGNQAVPFFWMLSGFVLASVYMGTPTTTREFMLNRIARLYPLHIVTLCVVAILQSIALFKFGTWLLYGNNDVYDFILNLGFASSWGLEHGGSFNEPIWSVSVEVLVYALFWVFRQRLKWVAFPFVILSYALLKLAPAYPAVPCALFFFTGCTLLLIPRKSWPVLLLIGCAGLYRGSDTIGTLGLFGALILVLVSIERFVPDVAKPKLQAVGDTTYGMYLWHIPLQLTLFMLLPVNALASRPWFLLLFLTLTVVLARLGFVFIERPMRRKLRGLGQPQSAPIAMLAT